jgi:carbonic anhydrase
MDARLHPEKALGIALGDSHVIRNAGGLGADSLRSLVISQQLLGTEEIYIVHHTDCGMLTFTNDVIHGVIQKNLGQDASKIDYLPFPDLDQSVIDDVNAVAASKLIKPGTPITGYVYDVNTGLVKVVATAETPVA